MAEISTTSTGEFDYDDTAVGRDPYREELASINVANPYLFQADAQGPWFKRLRDEDPVHYCPEHPLGPYWSVTRYEDIMAVDTNADVFSSEPSITIRDQDEDFQVPMFIAMDRPRHDEQRMVFNPAVGPASLQNF
jgi:cytochrome P450